MTTKNLFATVLTYAAPSSNYRGESEENRTIIQKITRCGQELPVISPESMRNALREILAQRGLPTNRSRLHNEDQLAVEFKEFPNAEKYADDFLFGFMVADTKKMPKGQPSKRDSVLRMNMAVGTSPYRFDATFHQSPMNAGASPWKNDSKSSLLHREVAHTAFQYPFALSFTDCARHKDGLRWGYQLVDAIAELSNVAGGHARSYFEMSPKSVVARVTSRLVGGFDTYGFDHAGHFPELARIHKDDLPGSEMFLGGDVVRSLSPADRQRLVSEGASLFDSPNKALVEAAKAAGGVAA